MTVRAILLRGMRCPAIEGPKRRAGDSGAAILSCIAEDCGDSSYARHSHSTLARRIGAPPSSVAVRVRRLVRLGLLEGDWITGWRLTAAGWEAQRGER